MRHRVLTGVWLAIFCMPACAGTPSSGDEDDDSGSGGEGGQVGEVGQVGQLGFGGEAGSNDIDIPVGYGGAAGGGVGDLMAGGAAGETPPLAGAGGEASTGAAGAGSGGTLASGGGGGTSGTGGTGGSRGTQPAEPAHPAHEIVWYERLLLFRGFRYPLATSLVKNWKSPVDYYNGNIHYRLVVTRNDKKVPIWFETIFWPVEVTSDATHGHITCTRASDLAKPGTYTCASKPTDVHISSTYFESQMRRIDLSAKYASSSGGRTPNEIPADVGFEVNMTIVLVPRGQTFSGWQNYFLPANLEAAGFKRM